MKYAFLITFVCFGILNSAALAEPKGEKEEKVDCADCNVPASRHPSFLIVDTVETASEMAEFTEELEKNLDNHEREVASEQ